MPIRDILVTLIVFGTLPFILRRPYPEAPEKLLLSVGNLVELKGHDLVIRAMAKLPGYILYIAGDGRLRRILKGVAEKESVSERLVFLCTVSQTQLIELYNRAKFVVLASRSNQSCIIEA